jgi:hypothetical protein
MFSLSVTRTKAPRLGALSFDPGAMRSIGQDYLAIQKQRIDRGMDANDQASRPLKPAYARSKSAHGAKPIRNLQNTGASMAAIGITEVGPMGFKISTSNDRANRVLSINQQIEPMLGASPNDIRTLMPRIESAFGESVQNLWQK